MQAKLTASLLMLGLTLTQWVSAQDSTQTERFIKRIEIPTTPVKDQASSGTCWAYATTSFIETELLRLGQEEMDLSEMYFVYFAYQRKAQKYLRYHGKANFGQGGQGHDVMHSLAEHGMLTEEAYSGLHYGTKQHAHTEMENILRGILDQSLKKERAYTGSALEIFTHTLDTYLGEIPETFSYQGKQVSPQDFVKTSGFNPADYIELTSYLQYPMYEAVDLELPDNWSHDPYYNVPLADLIRIIDAAFSQGYSVNWDGDVSDPGFSHRDGIAFVPEDDVTHMPDSERERWESLSEKQRAKMLYDFEQMPLEKVITDSLRARSFDLFRTTDDHLMHLVGTAEDKDGNTYYLTKNSWAADSNPYGGYLYMSKAYVALNTVAIQIHKDALPKDVRKKLGL